jgi:hypothetical protein
MLQTIFLYVRKRSAHQQARAQDPAASQSAIRLDTARHKTLQPPEPPHDDG